MKWDIYCRITKIANHIVDTGDTVRKTAKIFNVCKSTVSKDCERVKEINKTLYNEVKKVLEEHWSERYIRGGEATKQKYLMKGELHK